jgi:hypothetical protein
MFSIIESALYMLSRVWGRNHFLTPNDASLLGNATNNLWVLDLTLDLLDIRQAELQLIITTLILL